MANLRFQHLGNIWIEKYCLYIINIGLLEDNNEDDEFIYYDSIKLLGKYYEKNKKLEEMIKIYKDNAPYFLALYLNKLDINKFNKIYNNNKTYKLLMETIKNLDKYVLDEITNGYIFTIYDLLKEKK